MNITKKVDFSFIQSTQFYVVTVHNIIQKLRFMQLLHVPKIEDRTLQLITLQLELPTFSSQLN